MIRKNYNLQKLNTFGVKSLAERFQTLHANRDRLELDVAPALVLGGGSNVLLLDRIPGTTLHLPAAGILSAEPAGCFRVDAGVDWNQFVRHTLDRGFRGLENLILIPGTVGAAPVQNIGAYGAEAAEFITGVHVYEYGVGPAILSPEACAFGYRDSVFKRHPGRYLITAVDFDLRDAPPLRLEYGAIRTELARQNISDPTPQDVARAVSHIRRGKLPDWFFYGNSGSFFKNPVVPPSVHDALLADHPDCPAYPIDEAHVKLAAGWLIDRAGMKGARNKKGNVGTYARQALVMINYGGATGREILTFSELVRTKVLEIFGVELEREVRVFGT